MTEFTSPDGKFTWNGSSWVPIHSMRNEQRKSEVNDLVKSKLTELKRNTDLEKERTLEKERQLAKKQQQKIQPMVDKLMQTVLELVNSRSPESFASSWQVDFTCDAFQLKNSNPSIPFFVLEFSTRAKSSPSTFVERARPPWIPPAKTSSLDTRPNFGTWFELLPWPEMRESFIDGSLDVNTNLLHNQKIPHSVVPYQISRLLPLTQRRIQPLSEEFREIVSINYSNEHDMVVYSTYTRGVFVIENVSELYLEQHTFFHKSNRILSSDHGKINVARFCETTDEIILGGRKSGLLIYSIKSREIKKEMYVDGEITAAVYDKNVANYIVGTKYGVVMIFNEDGECVDTMTVFRTEEYECNDPIEELLIDPNGGLAMYPHTGYAHPELSRPVYAISSRAPNLFNNGILDEKNGIFFTVQNGKMTPSRYKQDETNTTSNGSPQYFFKPHYPEKINCSLSDMKEVIGQVNDEISQSGLNIMSKDESNFTLSWN